jgi:hypothetical protein
MPPRCRSKSRPMDGWLRRSIPATSNTGRGRRMPTIALRRRISSSSRSSGLLRTRPHDETHARHAHDAAGAQPKCVGLRPRSGARDRWRRYRASACEAWAPSGWSAGCGCSLGGRVRSPRSERPSSETVSCAASVASMGPGWVVVMARKHRLARPEALSAHSAHEPRARSSVDRASDFGSDGRGFESLRARHFSLRGGAAESTLPGARRARLNRGRRGRRRLDRLRDRAPHRRRRGRLAHDAFYLAHAWPWPACAGSSSAAPAAASPAKPDRPPQRSPASWPR